MDHEKNKDEEGSNKVIGTLTCWYVFNTMLLRYNFPYYPTHSRSLSAPIESLAALLVHIQRLKGWDVHTRTSSTKLYYIKKRYTYIYIYPYRSE